MLGDENKKPPQGEGFFKKQTFFIIYIFYKTFYFTFASAIKLALIASWSLVVAPLEPNPPLLQFQIFQHHGDAISQNGDDAIEVYEQGVVIETFGDVDVDGTRL